MLDHQDSIGFGQGFAQALFRVYKVPGHSSRTGLQ